MPTPQLSHLTLQYIGEAYTNHKLCKRLRYNGEHKWASIILFYSAVHLIEACNSHYQPNNRIENHDDRNEYVRHGHPRAIRAHYLHLYQVSKNLRYKLQTATEADLEDIHRDHFEPIRKHLRDVHGIGWIEPTSTPTSPS